MEPPNTALAAITHQEEVLLFDVFNNHTALDNSLTPIAMAKRQKPSVALNITRNASVPFHHGMNGTSRDRADWIRRKSNLVNRTGRSAYYVHTEVKNNGGDYDALPTLVPREYAAHGGAFPLKIRGVDNVGTITASALPGADDHAMVVAALKCYLNIGGAL